MCFYYKAFKASPVGRCTSRSAVRIIFLISLLCILPRKLRSLSCRRFKILKKPWIFGEKRDVAAALHSNPTFHLRRHVSVRLCLSSEVKDEQYGHRETTFPQGACVGGGSSTSPPPLSGFRWHHRLRPLRKVQHGGSTIEQLVMFPPIIHSFNQYRPTHE